MKLNRLTLRNFKGIKDFTLDTQGANVNVYGDNATGKTTLFDSFTWLLFDKDSANRKDFEIKTLTPEGETIHNVNHEVEGVLDVDGQEINLRKVYAEKWTKRRGQAKAEFTGHTTDYYINDVPVKKKEYEARVAEIAPEEQFKLLTSPTYFNEQLRWDKRREILLEVCGDISDANVIASDKELSRLPEILGEYSMEEYKKMIASRRAAINKELTAIPVRIDEAQLGLPDISTIDREHLQEDIDKLNRDINQWQQMIARIQSGGEVAEKTKALRGIESDLLSLKAKGQEKIMAGIQKKQKQLVEAQGMTISLRGKIAGYQQAIKTDRETVETLTARMEELRLQWHEINDENPSDLIDICPTCGQPMPEDKRQEALANFNRQKAERLEQINAQGKQLKAGVNDIQNRIKANQEQLAKAQDELDRQEAAANALQEQIDTLNAQAGNFAEDPDYQAKLKEKEALEKEIAELKAGLTDSINEAQGEIDKLTADLGTLTECQIKVKQYESGLKRIEALKAQEKKLSAEYERLEGELFLCDEFIRKKVEMLSERINSRFALARFKLFDVQVNGGVVECCETLYNGVPYSGGLNNAARINVGLDIINTLSEHYSFDAPIFIDNAEAVTQLIETKGQQIRLFVSESDKALRVEAEQTSNKEVA